MKGRGSEVLSCCPNRKTETRQDNRTVYAPRDLRLTTCVQLIPSINGLSSAKAMQLRAKRGLNLSMA